eukprot:Phypoly_transcript_05721.p1 GENE.Phypoly_transcript_05721~~Phypoly_transcript_05721.p1  ORF type:complete len:585 (+),score=70.87 Phypoly_transcript_05721:22-1755(+)
MKVATLFCGLLMVSLCFAGSNYTFSLSEDGYFLQNEKRFIAVGVNYWPGSSGVQMWNFWPANEIQHDLDVIKTLGFNTIRFFLLWDQFEPTNGEYNNTAFELLDTFLGWTEERGLVAHLSPFVGWMSGGYFWPTWKGHRDLFSDPVMINASVAYATKVASVAANHAAAILALEYGNELDVTSDVANATTPQIVAWCQAITEAYKNTFKVAGVGVPLVVAGTDRNMAHEGFPLGQIDVDFTSVHEYPVPGWQPIQDWTNVSDPLSQHLMAGYAAIAKAYTPTMIQEFGIIDLVDDQDSLTYLQNTLPLAWNQGVNGFLWWCLRDITYNGYPYNTNPIEHHLGLVYANDTIKPGYKFYVDFANQISKGVIPIPSPPSQNAIGIYWPTMYYSKSTVNNPGNDAADSSRRALILFHLLTLLKEEIVVVREDQLSTTNIKTIIIPCYAQAPADLQTISTFASKGGNIIWSGVAKNYFSEASTFGNFVGASPSGTTTSNTSVITINNQTYTLTTFKDSPRVTYYETTAKVISNDENSPAIFLNKYGSGIVITSIASVEDTITTLFGAERDMFSNFYRFLLSFT